MRTSIFIVIASTLFGAVPNSDFFSISPFSTPETPVTVSETIAKSLVETPAASIITTPASTIPAPALNEVFSVNEISPDTLIQPSIPTPEPAPVKITETPAPAVTVATPAPVSAPTPIPASAPTAPTVPKNSISVAGRTLNIVEVNSTSVESGNHVNHIGKLLYGHNSANVFANLSSLHLGDTFSVNLGGKTTTYQVAKITTYEKNPDGRLQLNGSGNYMKSIRDNASGYSLALMTCAGTSYGNGDASHRLVIFANAI